MMLAEICDVKTGFSRLKTGYNALGRGRFFDERLRKNLCFVLSVIIGIITLKTNKF